MLFTDWEVGIEKKFAEGLECTDQSRRANYLSVRTDQGRYKTYLVSPSNLLKVILPTTQSARVQITFILQFTCESYHSKTSHLTEHENN